MTVLHVGGLIPSFHRFKTLQDALEKAQNGDIIRLHKSISESVLVNKRVTIEGNHHTFRVENSTIGLKVECPITVRDITFINEPYSNAIYTQYDLNLINVNTQLSKYKRKQSDVEFYCTIYAEGQNLNIANSHLTRVVTSENTVTTIKQSFIESGVPLDQEPEGTEWNVLRGYTRGYESTFQGTEFWQVDLEKCYLSTFNKIYEGELIEPTFQFGVTFKRNERETIKIEAPSTDTHGYLLMVLEKLTLNQYRLRIPKENHKMYVLYGLHSSVYMENVYFRHHFVNHYFDKCQITVKDLFDQNYYHCVNGSKISTVRSQVNSSSQEQAAMEKLNNLIGLTNMKEQLQDIIANAYAASKQTKDTGFSYHMVFSGNPGSAKTTVARIVAQALFEVGLLPENKLTEASADRLIKGYVGQTGENVRQILDEALGGVLFIDEAYQLTTKDGVNSFNEDVIAPLIRYMEDHRDKLVVITAGYPKEMKEFIASNVGLSRRMQWVDFEDYTTEELTKIFYYMCEQDNRQVDVDYNTVYDYIEQLTRYYLTHPDNNGRVTNGGNGGLMRNLYQSVVTVINRRMMDGHGDEVMTSDDFIKGYEKEFVKARQLLEV